MKNRDSSVEENLCQIAVSLFEKEISQSKILPQLAQVSQDRGQFQQSCILFSLYNYIFCNDLKMAFQCLQKAEDNQQNISISSVTTLIVRSALLAESKQHKQSLNLLFKAYQFAQKDDVQVSYAEFYRFILCKIIQLFDLSTFRKEYLNLIESIIEKYGEQQKNEIIKVLEGRKKEIKKKICGISTKPKIGTLGSKEGKSILTFKETERQSVRASGLNSRDKSGRSNLYSPKSKMGRNFKKMKYINPYNLENMMNKESCVFM